MPAPKIMIIRHAEKPITTSEGEFLGVTINGIQNQDSLIIQGWRRAGGLVSLFKPANGQFQNSDLATPQFLFATSTSAEGGNRPEETIIPLQLQLNLTPTLFPDSQSEEVATAAMACSGVALICWPHGQIPNVTAAIPVDTNPFTPGWGWPGTRFDMVFVFDLDTSTGKYTFNQVPQLLLSGDSSAPIPIDTKKQKQPIS